MRKGPLSVGRAHQTPLFEELVAKGASGRHAVDMFLMTDAVYLAPQGANVHLLPFTMMDFYKFAGNPSKGTDHPNPRVKFVGGVADIICELILPCVPSVQEVAKDASVLVTSALARPLALLLGSKNGIPVSIVHLQPLVPTRDFPHYSHTEAFLEAILSKKGDDANVETYTLLERFQHEFTEERLAGWYRELGVPMIRFEEDLLPMLRGERKEILVAIACCPELIPALSDAGPHVHQVGALADRLVPIGWEPPAGLEEFLQASAEPPVCVGYGSMPFDKAVRVVEALKRLGERAVFVGDALKCEDDEWISANIFQVSSVPYPWLLPRCSMMLSHGGAGVVNSTLRAGIPPVISPLLGDQFFHAALLEQRGIGAQAAELKTLTADDVASGIQKAKACKAAAREVGEALRAQSYGPEVLVKLLATATS
ncbi:UGT80B1 [Symbiodinium natans]|uniref:UGT80B1 protein n=1 Tax=Symbiodinium natans TaxID=878477 RepID=A0A812QNR1_9DINO|nr:UGT80B1 [Symbiodinium natans]